MVVGKGVKYLVCEKSDVEPDLTLSCRARRRRAARFATVHCYTIGRNLGTVSGQINWDASKLLMQKNMYPPHADTKRFWDNLDNFSGFLNFFEGYCT